MDTRRLPELRNTPPNTTCPAWRMVAWSRPPLPKGGSSAFIADALSVDGVLDVFTHEHRPKLASSYEKYTDEVAPSGSPFRPLYDDKILFSGQPVALVVAEEFEIARF